MNDEGYLIRKEDARVIASAVKIVLGSSSNEASSSRRFPSTIGMGFAFIVVKNTTEEDLPPFSIVRISREGTIEVRGVIDEETPGDPEDELNLGNVVWEVEKPDSGITGNYAVTQVKIPKGKKGKAILNGVSKVLLDDTNEGDFANPVEDSFEKMESTSSGKFPILAVREAGSSSTWGYIVLGAGGVSSAVDKYARITSKVGTSAPWVYTGVQVAHDGSNSYHPTDNFTEVSSGDNLSNNMINGQEIGPPEVGACPVEVGTVVKYYPLSSGKYWFERFPYRGSY